jgi:hypothetical protein
LAPARRMLAASEVDAREHRVSRKNVRLRGDVAKRNDARRLRKLDHGR